MNTDAVFAALMERATVRKFTDQDVSDEVIERIAKAGRQAPYATPMYSVLVTKDPEKKRVLHSLFGALGAAPVFFLICMDIHKMECLIGSQGRFEGVDDLNLLMWSIQDAAYVAQNMVTAADAMGLGSCYLGGAPWKVETLSELFRLPDRVFPLVGLVMGYPAEFPAPRPRISMNHVLHWEEYRSMTADDVEKTLRFMDEKRNRSETYRDLMLRKYRGLGHFPCLRQLMATKGISVVRRGDVEE